MSADGPATLRVRPMTAADVGRVVDLTATLPEAPHWTAAAYRMAVESAGEGRRLARVAEEILSAQPISGIAPESGNFAAKIVGFAVLSLVPPEAELETIGVATEARRRGVARCLWDDLAVPLRRVAITEVLLEVRPSNQAARALYAALGFVESGVRPRYYVDPMEDALLMRLPLL